MRSSPRLARSSRIWHTKHIIHAIHSLSERKELIEIKQKIANWNENLFA